MSEQKTELSIQQHPPKSQMIIEEFMKHLSEHQKVNSRLESINKRLLGGEPSKEVEPPKEPLTLPNFMSELDALLQGYNKLIIDTVSQIKRLETL